MAFTAVLRLLAFAALGAVPATSHVVGTCGADLPSKVPDCQNNDCGSCGGACCQLEFEVEEDTAATVMKLNASILGGGPDGSYVAQVTAEGPLGFGDLRPFKKPVDFIGQAHHTTSGPKHYMDSVAFTVARGANGAGSVVHGCSMSLIAGAFCDNGQNYKNLVMLMKGTSWRFGFTIRHLDSSCPVPQHEVVV